ncbi:hypothetical protein LEN26_011285 [Aphanomyces euteiches]|nr:hypothetical protein LEN26_011285 [Aphanomyces euteiches]
MKHPLLSSSLFANPQLLSSLKDQVVLESDRILSTGIPPHVDMMKSIEKNYNAIASLPSDIVAQIEKVLHDHGVQTGQITRQYLESTLDSYFSRVNCASSLPAPATEQPAVGSLYCWGGRLTKVPPDFEFPSVGVASAWRLWWLGNKRRGHPPYRFIVPVDLPTTRERKQLSNWKFVMGRLDIVCRASGLRFSSTPTEEEVSQSLGYINSYLHRVCASVPGKRSRRTDQLHLVSLVRPLRAVANDFE